jgi:FkbM family methyltransferase
MNAAFKNLLKRWVPQALVQAAMPFSLRRRAARLGISIRARSGHFDVRRGGDTLRLARTHAIYLNDLVTEFDYFFSGVEALATPQGRLVDFSSPRYHDVIGYPDYPVLFPSMAEPVLTTRQYLGFAGLAEGMVVLDLGAYSGLTSMLFSRAVGRTGQVVAVEADAGSLACARVNFRNFARYCGNPIHLLEGAVWEHNQGIEFGSDGTLGASASAIMGGGRGTVVRTPSYTLGAIVEKFGLERVDFIKCDVEGGEKVVFRDKAFFQRFSPRIIIETHFVDGVDTQAQCAQDLGAYGYRCIPVKQDSYALPLLECSPPPAS